MRPGTYRARDVDENEKEENMDEKKRKIRKERAWNDEVEREGNKYSSRTSPDSANT